MQTTTGALPRLRTAIPQLLVHDVVAAAERYRDRLGFAIDFYYGEPPFYACVRRDGVELHLKHVGQPELGRSNRAAGDGSIDVYIHTDGIQALFEEMRARGATIVGELEAKPWGLREFEVETPGGYILCFAERIEGG